MEGGPRGLCLYLSRLLQVRGGEGGGEGAGSTWEGKGVRGGRGGEEGGGGGDRGEGGTEGGSRRKALGEGRE